MDDTTLRPSWDTYRKWAGASGTVVGVLIVVAVVGFGGWRGGGLGGLALSVALVLGLVAVIFGSLAITIMSSSITVLPDRLVSRSWGRRRTVSRGALTHALRAPYRVQSVKAGTSEVDQLVIVGDGRRIRVNGGYWSPQDLEDLTDLVGARRISQPLGPAGWEKELPGSMTLTARRPVLVAVVGTFSVLGLFAAYIAVGVWIRG